jgi:hypothetical protein
MDLITDLPPPQCYDTQSFNSFVSFVVILAKQAIFVGAIKLITSQQVAHILIDHVFSKDGLPFVIVSDQDPRITSDCWQTLFSQSQDPRSLDPSSTCPLPINLRQMDRPKSLTSPSSRLHLPMFLQSMTIGKLDYHSLSLPTTLMYIPPLSKALSSPTMFSNQQCLSLSSFHLIPPPTLIPYPSLIIFEMSK